MSVFAMFVGYTAMSLIGMVLLAALVLWLIAMWPVSFQWTNRPPGYIKVPSGNNDLNINLIAGLGARGKARWFFGLMLFEKRNP